MYFTYYSNMEVDLFLSNWYIILFLRTKKIIVDSSISCIKTLTKIVDILLLKNTTRAFTTLIEHNIFFRT